MNIKRESNGPVEYVSGPRENAVVSRRDDAPKRKSGVRHTVESQSLPEVTEKSQRSVTPAPAEEHLLQKLFSFEGRIKRFDFWFWGKTVPGSLLFGVFILQDWFPVLWEWFARFSVELIFGFGILWFWSSWATGVKRLRDAGFSPWAHLVGIIPYLGGFILAILYMLPSKAPD